MQTAQNPQQRLVRAKIALLLDHPFFGTLATRLPNYLDETVPTACTNGEEIRWNPAWLAALPDAEVRGVLAHEVMHVACGHTWRRGNRQMPAWNVACDLAINHILKEAGLALPKGGLFPTAVQAGKAAEALYEAEPEGDGNSKGKEGADPGRCGGVEDAPAGEKGAQEEEWKVAMAQAAMAAKAAGKLPGSLARLVEEIVNPRIPWTVVLRDFVERAARNDYNWARPNRRHLGRGIVLPSLLSEELPAVVVAVDTSGSIGGKEMSAFAAEVSAVLGAYETTIHLVYADARVADTETLTRADLPLVLKPKGGGGTDFRPTFAWVGKENLEPAVLIYLTDLEGTFPTAEPTYPVLWVATTKGKAPWGTTLQMDTKAA